MSLFPCCPKHVDIKGSYCPCIPVDTEETDLGAEGAMWWFLFYKIVLGTEALLSFASIPTSQSS